VSFLTSSLIQPLERRPVPLSVRQQTCAELTAAQ